jgi:hypothetical protein
MQHASSHRADIVRCVTETVLALPSDLVTVIVQYMERRKLLLLGGFNNMGGLTLPEVLSDTDALCLASETITSIVSKEFWIESSLPVKWPLDDRIAIIRGQAVVFIYDVQTGEQLVRTKSATTGPDGFHDGFHSEYFILRGELHALVTRTGVLSKLLLAKGEGEWSVVHCPAADDWEPIAAGHMASVVDMQSGRLYLGLESGSVYQYDCATGARRELSSMCEHRSYFSLALVNDRLYAIGNAGWRVSSVQHKRVECLDVSDSAQQAGATWELGPDQLVERWGPAVCVVDDVIVVAGGRDSSRSAASAEYLDTMRLPLQWRWLPPCQFAREEGKLLLL